MEGEIVRKNTNPQVPDLTDNSRGFRFWRVETSCTKIDVRWKYRQYVSVLYATLFMVITRLTPLSHPEIKSFILVRQKEV
jgi:hypothetical protein